MGRAKRLALVALSAAMLTAGSAAPVSVFAVGDFAVTLSCSDGTQTNLTVDTPTLLQLKDAVEAMTLYPAGLSCTLADAPLGGGLGLINNSAIAASGTSDFAVGGGRYACGTGFINFSVSAHRHENGKVNGQIGETIPQDIPSCGVTKGHFKADVECFSAVGNVGFGKALATQASGYYAELGAPGPVIPGTTYIKFGANDNTGVPDLWNNTISTSCPEVFYPGVVPLANGNIVVRDNLP